MKKTRNNHEDIYPAGPTYIRTVKAGDTLYISGTTARYSDSDGGSPMAQLRAVLDRITRIVAAEGGRPSDIVAMTTYLTNIADFWPIEGEQKEIWDEYFQGEWPTNAYVEVSALAEPGLSVEITATAVLD
ncbi:MAG: RidA family protein [Chloroflexi bacterium]|nr:RidA family protein [Chloroflexota bacterium]